MRSALLLVALALTGCLSDLDLQRREAERARGEMVYDLREDLKYGPVLWTTEDDVAALTSAVTVEAVQAAVLRRNPDLLAALQRWVAALERAPQVTSLPYPVVQYRYSSMFRMHSVGAEQMLPWPGKLLADGRTALADARAARADWREVEGVARAQAASGVAALWLARRQLALVDENLALMDRFVGIAETKYAAGTVTQSDVLRAQVEREGLLAERALFAREAAVAEAALDALLDRPLDAPPLGPVDLPRAAAPPGPVAALLLRALDARPALQAVGWRAHAALEARRRAEQEWLPDAVLGGAYVRDAGADRDEVELMGGLTLPLWPGRVRAARAEADARLRGAQAEERAAHNRVLEEVRAGAARLTAALERRRILEEGAAPRARQNVEVAEAAYVAGQLDLLGLIDAQRGLLAQELELARATAEQVAARAALDQAVGLEAGR
ncbi:MAG: TolC family protein [Planctomycetes bacterium]|nr:TolC family protein [Planctomycetota bacterium]